MTLYLRRYGPLLVILLLSFWAFRPLLSPGYFSMHDDQQVVRLAQMDKSLSAGQFPVRWVEDLGFGYGYALFNFYPPLVYYLGEFYHLFLRVGYIDSTKLVWVTALVASGMAMYFLAKEFFGKVGGVVSAVFYVYAPYHAVDAYVRGALAELFSFVWLPLALLLAYKANKTNELRFSVWAGIFLAFLMITHNLIFLPFIGIFSLWWFAMWFIYDRQALVFSVGRYLVAVSLAFGLTAFFWLPSLLEKQYTLVDQLLIRSLASYKIHFVCLSQLWSSPWGFGGSVPGCADGLSLSVGKLHILTALFGFGAGVFVWTRKKADTLLTLTVGLILAAFSIFMTTDLSGFVWDRVSYLWYLQFPWRFLEFVVLFTSFLSGAVVMAARGKVMKVVLAMVLIGLVIFVEGKYFRPQFLFPKATDTLLTSEVKTKWEVSGTSFEFMPSGVATYINSLGVVWPDIDISRIAKTSYRMGRGDFFPETVEFYPGRFYLSGSFRDGAIVEIQQTNFPGWKVWIDGKGADIGDNNRYKLMSVAVPTGRHIIVGRFTDTPARSVGNLISFSGIILASGYFLYGVRRTKK